MKASEARELTNKRQNLEEDLGAVFWGIAVAANQGKCCFLWRGELNERSRARLREDGYSVDVTVFGETDISW